MPSQPPLTPGGTKADVAYNNLVHYVRALRPMRGNGTQTTFSSSGVVRRASPQAPSRGLSLYMYRITSLHGGNFFGAMLFDQSQYAEPSDFVVNGGGAGGIAGDPSLSGGEIIVAKSINGQQVNTAVIDGYNITYTSSGENLRFAEADSLGSEWQVCHPRYTVGDYVVVSKLQNYVNVLDNNGQPFQYMEMSPLREWCYQNGQSGT